MVLVKGGSFQMGNSKGLFDFNVEQQPVHKVELSDFFIERFEVTNEEYIIFLNDLKNVIQIDSTDKVFTNGVGIKYMDEIYIDVLNNLDSTIKAGIVLVHTDQDIHFELIKGKEKFPVTYTSWYGANAYCEWKYKNGGLPTESQWEYAARGGIFWKLYDFKYSGSNHLDSVAWYWDNAKFRPHQVGLKKPNKLGLYDMSGNLWEWVEDHWHDNYNNAPKDEKAWLLKNAPKDHNRVLRGGAWYYSQGQATVTNRWSDVPDDRHNYKGFRCVCNSKPIERN